MGTFNQILVPRFNKFLQKQFGLKGPPPAPALATEIMPVIAFSLDVSDFFNYGWDIYAQPAQQPGGVGVTSNVRLRNPAGSNVVAEVFRWDFFVSVADQVSLEKQAINTDLTTLLVTQSLDPRGRVNSTLQASRGNGPATLANGLLQGVGLINTYQPLILYSLQAFPILPGDAYQLRTIGFNETLTVNLQWRERYLEETERT